MKHNEDMFKWIPMLRLRIQIWSTSYYHVICNLFQFVCTWKFNGIYRAFQLVFRPIHGYSSRDKFMKIFENYHEFGDTYFAQCFGSNQYEKLADMSKYSKTHVLWTHILCELIFYANIHFTRIKDTWYIYAKPMWKHFTIVAI